MENKAVESASPLDEDSINQLQQAAICTWGATEALSLVEYAEADSATTMLSADVIGLDMRAVKETADQRDLLLGYAREEYEKRYPREDDPRRPAVGRVVHLLTIERADLRGTDSCNAGDVFRVFLEEFPDEMVYDPDDYLDRGASTASKKKYCLEKQPARRIFNKRLAGLHDDGFCQAVAVAHGGKRNTSRLTDRGRLMFDTWPDLKACAAPPS